MRKTAPLIGLKNIQVILNLRFDFCGIKTPQVNPSDVKVQNDVIYVTDHMTSLDSDGEDSIKTLKDFQTKLWVLDRL